jgi:hypothetical protein
VVSDFRGSGFASIRFVGANNNLNVTNLEMKLNLQALNVGLNVVEGSLGRRKLSHNLQCFHSARESLVSLPTMKSFCATVKSNGIDSNECHLAPTMLHIFLQKSSISQGILSIFFPDPSYFHLFSLFL